MPYLDIAWEARTNPQFVAKIKKLTEELRELERRKNHRFDSRASVASKLFEIYEACNYNVGLLMPWFFPRAIAGKGMTLTRRPFAFALYDLMFGGETTIRGSRQISKCRVVGSSEPVSAWNGRPLYPAELLQGETVIGMSDQYQVQPHRIVARHDAGIQKAFRVRCRSGAVMDLSEGHLLKTLQGYRRVDDLQPGDMVAVLREGGEFTGSVKVSRARLLLTAYMIGDGCNGCSLNFSFTSACREALDEFTSLAQPLQDEDINETRKEGQQSFSLGISFKSQLRSWLEEDGSWGKRAWEKRLPAWVFDLSREDSRLFLSRLWATDGMVRQNSTGTSLTYSTTSYQLARDVRALLTKFGFVVSVKEVKTGYKKDGVFKHCRNAFVVRIETREGWQRFMELMPDIPGKPPIALRDVVSNNNRDVVPREIFSDLEELMRATSGLKGASLKAAKLTFNKEYHPSRSKLRRYVTHFEAFVPDHPALKRIKAALDGAVAWTSVLSVEPLGDQPVWDIETDGDHNYVLDGVVSHNSTNFAGRQLINQHMRPQWRSMYIVPHTEHRNTYATKLREMESHFRYYETRHDLRQNMFLKESCNDNGSTIELHHAFTSVAHLRGKTADECLYDEYQLFDTGFEDDLEQVLKASETPVRVYGGTSTTLDSPLEARYQASSMATWHIRSPDGKHWIDCGDREVALRMIRPDGPRCPWSNQPLNVVDGCWVHQYEDRIERHMVGYHVPQLIIPEYAHDYLFWSEIYRVFKKGDEAKFLQELMGIPVAEGSRELTEGDLHAICVLGPQEKLKIKVKKKAYKFIVSGVDWGGSDRQDSYKTKKSYTVHVIIGVLSDGSVDILYMRRYSGMEYGEITQSIYRDHKDWGATMMASDWGVGALYNNEIRNYIPWNRHMVFEYLGPNTHFVGVPSHGAHILNHYTVNKSEAVTAVVQAIKRNPPRVRCYEWGDARDYLLDFINMYRVPSENVNGRSAFRFIKNPAKTDDALHAFSFAYLMARIMLGEPVFTDNSVRDIMFRTFQATGVSLQTTTSAYDVMDDIISG